MDNKIITPDELDNLHKSGAKITHEEKPTEILGLNLLVDQLSSIAKSNQIVAGKKSEQIKETLEYLAETIALKKDIDMKPILVALSEIQKNTIIHEKIPHTYTFEIERDQRGFAKTITAKPVTGLTDGNFTNGISK